MTSLTYTFSWLSGYVWLVMFQHDIPGPCAGSPSACHAANPHRERFAQTNVIVDAMRNRAITKFAT
jgi:hypothetical protein